MASSSNVAKEAEGDSSTVPLPNWLELPKEITANILQRLDTIDIVKIACQVCPQWWNVCKDPLVWRTIRMTSFSCSLYFHAELVKICRYAVERSCDHLEEVDIEYFCTDQLLECITVNGSNLRRLRLLDCQQISDIGFSEAVSKLPQLEEVDISFCDLLKCSLKVLGRSCPRLKSLKFVTIGLEYFGYEHNDEEAFVIAETMPGIRHLKIRGNMLTNDGLLAILDGCPLLESLNIAECNNLRLSEGLRKRCREQIKYVRMWTPPYDDEDVHVSYQDSILTAIFRSL